MLPSGQIIGLKGNQIEEPLQKNNGLEKWTIYGLDKVHIPETSSDLLHPYVFMGMFHQKNSDDRDLKSQIKYYIDNTTKQQNFQYQISTLYTLAQLPQ